MLVKFTTDEGKPTLVNPEWVANVEEGPDNLSIIYIGLPHVFVHTVLVKETVEEIQHVINGDDSKEYHEEQCAECNASDVTYDVVAIVPNTHVELANIIQMFIAKDKITDPTTIGNVIRDISAMFVFITTPTVEVLCKSGLTEGGAKAFAKLWEHRILEGSNIRIVYRPHEK